MQKSKCGFTPGLLAFGIFCSCSAHIPTPDDKASDKGQNQDICMQAEACCHVAMPLLGEECDVALELGDTKSTPTCEMFIQGIGKLLQEKSINLPVVCVSDKKNSTNAVEFESPESAVEGQGHLSREKIQEVVSQHLGEIQACYEKNLLMTPGLQGKAVLEWTVELNGSISGIKTVSNTMKTPAVAECISAAIGKWIFPVPQGGTVKVNYPFIFNQVGF